MAGGSAVQALLIVFSLLVLATGALLVIELVRARGERREPAPAKALPPAEARAPEPHSALAIPRAEARGRELPAARAPEVDPLAQISPRRFEGSGTLRVRLTARPGVAFPERWTLVVAPSKVLIGGEHASSRRIELSSGEREFVLDDLPLGGYEVRAEAPAMSSAPVLALLARPDETEADLVLEIYPAGFLAGAVFDEAGVPVEGLEVVLESATDRSRRSATTAHDGRYRFDDVLDGEYSLSAGGPERPLAPPLDIGFLAPSLHAPAITVPILGALEIRVLDRAGQPVPDARVEGYAHEGGRIDARTDERGDALARFLAPGEYVLFASHPERGQGRARGAVRAGEHAAVELRLGP